MITNIKKENSKFIDDIFRYKDRTIAISFIKNTEQLEQQWEETQYELIRLYQYEDTPNHIWDYYLLFLCSFDNQSFDPRLQFKIENDKFGCRKQFLFDQPRKTYLANKIVDLLFPNIEINKTIQIIKPESLLQEINSDLTKLLDLEFYTKELDIKQLESMIDSLLLTGVHDELHKKN